MRNHSLQNAGQKIILTLFTLFVLASCGCHDGPLYALKHVNPYFTLKEWREDREIGVTDHERRNQLLKLTDNIAGMSAKDQAYWAQHLQRIVDNDPSAEMRRLAINAVGKLRNPAAVAVIDKGLKDDNLKVRMEACRALGKRSDPQAVQMLAKVAGSETDQDVKHAAIAALGNHKSQAAVNSLRIALEDRNPATQHLAINSLKSVTGRDLGKPNDWIRALSTPPNQSGAAPGSPPVDGSAVQVAGAISPAKNF